MNSNYFISRSFLFFLGRSTKDLHFHVYLVDGIVQWNKSRSAAAAEEVSPMQRYANHMSQKLLGCKLVEDHNSSGEYTGNVFLHSCFFQCFSAV